MHSATPVRDAFRPGGNGVVYPSSGRLAGALDAAAGGRNTGCWKFNVSGGSIMKVSMFSIAVVLLSVFACLQACVAKPADDKLDEKIPKADKKKYESIRDGKDWANPFLVVTAEGVEIRSKGIAKGRKTVATKELRKTLTSLPVSAWPYGRVVAVVEIGIRSDNDDALIKENRKSVEKILKDLEVSVDPWPSA